MPKENEALLTRVHHLRQGLGTQPFARLYTVVPSLLDDAPRYRRILCGKVFPGDVHHIEKMEQAKQLLKQLHEQAVPAQVGRAKKPTA